MATGNALKTPTHILEAVRTMTATIAIELKHNAQFGF